MVPAQNYRHNERAKQLIRTEVAVMDKIRRMGHANLMQFKHTFEDSEKIVMVLEFLSGEQQYPTNARWTRFWGLDWADWGLPQVDGNVRLCKGYTHPLLQWVCCL